MRERARTLHLASSSIDELDEIGIDYAHFVLAGEEGREPYVADRSLARHEVRAELVLAHPPSQRKALMCDVPQSCCEVATRGIKPFGLRHLASTGGWVHVEAASGHERAREVHDLRLREVALQGGDGLLLSSHQRVHAGEVVEAASQVDVQPWQVRVEREPGSRLGFGLLEQVEPCRIPPAARPRARRLGRLGRCTLREGSPAMRTFVSRTILIRDDERCRPPSGCRRA